MRKVLAKAALPVVRVLDTATNRLVGMVGVRREWAWGMWQRGQEQTLWGLLTPLAWSRWWLWFFSWYLWAVYFPICRGRVGASSCQGRRDTPLSRRRRWERERAVASRIKNSSSYVCKRRGIAARIWTWRMSVWSLCSAAAQAMAVFSRFSRPFIMARVSLCMDTSRFLSSVFGSGESFSR